MYLFFYKNSNHEFYLIITYLITIFFYLLHIKYIPHKYENIYNKMINVKVIEKNHKFYLCKDSIKYLENEVIFKL